MHELASYDNVVLLVTGVISCVALILNHWHDRPSKQIDERFDKIDAVLTNHLERLSAIESWKNS